MPPPKSLLRAVAVLGLLALAGQAAFTCGSRAGLAETVQVQRGDSLWGLSQRYGIAVDRLAAANHMKMTDVLLAGRTIELPGLVRPASPAKAVAPTKSRASTRDAATAAAMRTFCTTYRAPTGPRGPMPSDLLAHRERLALRPLFAKWSKAYGVPTDLVEAEAWQESGWQNNVVSSADARGIGQLLPQTADFMNHLLGTHLKMTVPEDNIRMMVGYLAYLLKLTKGQVCGAVASYYEGFSTLTHVGVLPESQVYVRSVLGLRPHFR